MRKTILMLINGFGIERKDSAEVFSASLMPTLDKLTKEYLFSSLETPAGDYSIGYKQLCLKESPKNQTDEIDNLIYEKQLNKIEALSELKGKMNINNTLQIFYVVNEEENKVNQLCSIIKELNPDKSKKVFVHLVLTSSSVNEYSVISKIIEKLAYEMLGYCKVGFVVGKNNINNNDTLRCIYKEYGEHWNEFNKKIEVLKKDIINPEDASVFIINKEFSFKEGDIVFFANYQDCDVTKITSEFFNIKLLLYSLYFYNNSYKNIFEKDKKNNSSITDILEKYGIKLLVLTKNDRIDDINFYFNGMQKKESSNITYATNNKGLFSSAESTINTLKNDYDGIIIDYEIGSFTRMEDIKSELSTIDSLIKNISEVSKENDYTFIITSVYGMHATVAEGVLQKIINFSGKVPIIYQNNTYNKHEYSLNSGNLYALSQTFLTNICDDVKSNKLVHKMSGIEKALSKK